MKTRYLFHHKYKKVGWVFFIIGVIAGLSYFIYDIQDLSFFDVKIFTLFNQSFGSKNINFSINENNILNEIILAILIIGGVLVAFSKTKDEDELISKVRMESLVLATYINYLILIMAIFLTYGFAFVTIMIFNLFTTLIFFIIIFHYKLYKLG